MHLRPALRTTFLFLFLAFTVFAASLSAQTHAQRSTLDIYVIDVEGGNAVLFVTPANESVLIDSGREGVSASRIFAAAKDAVLSQIDHAITTHYDGDHYEGLAAVAAEVPIKDYIDHGPTTQPNPRAEQFLQETYPGLYSKAKHTIVKPGDKIPLTGVDWRIVASAENMIKVPVPGGGIPNPYCSSFAPPTDAPFSTMEDPQSVASFIAFGKFRTVHFGDLTQKAEFELMCPRNPIGTVDVLLGLHHGQLSSNSIVAIHALRPRVAIMNNGTMKGGEPEVMKTIYSSPGLEDLWEMHFSALSGQEYTVPGIFIANLLDDQPSAMPIAPKPAPPRGPNRPPDPLHNGAAYWIKVSAQRNGTFTVTNSRNGFTKTYENEK
jgi:beta-lactamase superfamily II metal-dependent hydrolase